MVIMKVLVIILCLANVAIIKSDGDSNTTDFQHNLDVLLEKHWAEYKTKFNKVFVTTEEDRARKTIYQDNIVAIARHNVLYASKMTQFTVEINNFGDMNRDEFVAKLNGFKKHLVDNVKNYPEGDASTFVMSKNINVPKSIDWRQKGFVTPVKTQGMCGSCWSFSATGSLEGQHFRKTGQLVSFSEQNLIDCSRMYGNYGCEGGLMNLAFKYIKSNKGLEANKSYPYEAKDNRCHYNHQNSVTRDIGFVIIPEGDENALMKAVGTVGPVSVAIDASSTKFQFYHDGIYENSECNSTALDHGVLVVGYDTDSNKRDYWIVKNSWGTQWGKQGYIYMARNKNNHCGIASSASYPVVV